MSRKKEGGMEVDEVPTHQCISLFYLHSAFKVISLSLSLSLCPVLLLFSLYFPYQSILIIGRPAPHLRLPLAFPPTLPPSLRLSVQKRGGRRRRGERKEETLERLKDTQ